MKLKDVQFYGRAAADVVQMFGLSADLQVFQGCRVLDCPGGPSSFTATLAAAGIDTDPGAIVDIGKEAGFVVSIDEVQKAQAELSNVELSDEDLDNVAGGFHACATF